MLNTVAAWVIVGCYLAFGWAAFRQALTRLARRIGDFVVAPLVLPYLLAVELRPDAVDLIKLVAYLAVPTLLLRFSRRGGKALDLAQILAILAIWVPIEADLFALIGDMVVPGLSLAARANTLQLLPSVRATLFAGLSLPIGSMTAVLLALVLFLARHPVSGVGMTFGLVRRDLRQVLIGLAAFAIVGIPVGLFTGFLSFAPSPGNPREIVLGLVGGYLFTALPEELLFRGVIQNLISRRTKREWIGLIIASILFGLSHLNNRTRGLGVPNWTYVVMATLAGLSYGWVWMSSHKITASAITHALVNGLWGAVFR